MKYLMFTAICLLFYGCDDEPFSNPNCNKDIYIKFENQTELDIEIVELFNQEFNVKISDNSQTEYYLGNKLNYQLSNKLQVRGFSDEENLVSLCNIPSSNDPTYELEDVNSNGCYTLIVQEIDTTAGVFSDDCMTAKIEKD